MNSEDCQVTNAQIARDFKSVTVDCAQIGSMAVIETEGLVEAKALSEMLTSNGNNIKIFINTVSRHSMLATATINFRK